MIIYDIFKILLIICLIFFIIRNITINKHKKIRGIVFLITSIVLIVFFTISYIVDSKNLKIEIEYYIATLVITFGFLVYAIIMIAKSTSLPRRIKKEMVYTYFEKERALYLLYYTENYIYLLRDHNSGIKYKLKKSEFVDDIITAFNKKMFVDPLDIEKKGITTQNLGKKELITYCYMVKVNDDYINEALIKYDKKSIISLEIDKFDKIIILNCLMKTDFNETL